MTAAARAAVAAIAVGLAISSPAWAQPRPVLTHQVGPNDSLELLAAEYYGDRRYASLLRLANDLDEPRALRRGERLRIPVGLRLVTVEGDRFETLAAKHLGDEARAAFLAEYNDRAPGISLAAGELVRVPFQLRFVADERTSLGVIAARYLRGSRDMELLRAYNALDEELEALSSGASIEIPALHIAVRGARLPRLTEAELERLETRREAVAAAEDALPAARHAWRRGDYAEVIRRLDPLALAFLDAEVAQETSVYLGGAHLARGDDATAEAVFLAALERDASYAMSAYHFSPAIRALWEKLGGRIDTSSR